MSGPTEPLMSTHKDPFEAVIPTDWGGPVFNPSISVGTVSAVAQSYGVAGAQGELTSVNYNHVDEVGFPPDSVVPNGFATKLQAAQQGFPLFSLVTHTHTDPNDSSNNYVSTTVFNQDGTVTASGPDPLYDIGNVDLFETVSVFETQDSSGVTDQYVMSNAVDMVTPWQNALAQLHGTPTPAGNGTSSFTGIGQAANGWVLSPVIPTGGIGSGRGVTLTKQKLLLNVTNKAFNFFIARFQAGFTHGQWSPDIGSDIFQKITFVSSGIIYGGQTIGAAEDNPTIILPFPDTVPVPVPPALGASNALLLDSYFCVVGDTWPHWIATHAADNDP